MTNVDLKDETPTCGNVLLCAVFIENLPNTNEKIIDKYLRQISREIGKEAKIVGIGKARQNANIKYGKGWRETLTAKKIYNCKNPFGKMSYF
jgi:hypothetical protein